MIEPGDQDSGADKHRQRQRSSGSADREPCRRSNAYIAASAETVVARRPGPRPPNQASKNDRR
jgi:hypothetical protein